MFHSLSLFFFGMSFTLLLTSLGKRFAGRLRPNFLAVCKPNNLNSSICISSYGTYNAIYTGGSFCTGHANKVAQARMSFPSGHSSFSTYTMLFLVIYLQARLVTLKFRASMSKNLFLFKIYFFNCINHSKTSHTSDCNKRSMDNMFKSYSRLSS